MTKLIGHANGDMANFGHGRGRGCIVIVILQLDGKKKMANKRGVKRNADSVEDEKRKNAPITSGGI